MERDGPLELEQCEYCYNLYYLDFVDTHRRTCPAATDPQLRSRICPWCAQIQDDRDYRAFEDHIQRCERDARRKGAISGQQAHPLKFFCRRDCGRYYTSKPVRMAHEAKCHGYQGGRR